MKKYELNYKGFEQYLVDEENPDIMGKATYRFKFENGYGANVSVSRDTRYRTLWAVSLLTFKKYWFGELYFNNPFMKDVESHLTDEDVIKLLQEIKDFK